MRMMMVMEWEKENSFDLSSKWTQVSTDCEKWKKDEKCTSQSQIKMLIKIYRFGCASIALQPITELM